MLETLFINARLVDGTGAPWFRGRVGVSGDRIVFVERGTGAGKASALRVVDVADRVLAPGFIDIHTHMDLALLGDPLGQGRLAQGVTTQVIGQCGFSAAPRHEVFGELLERSLAFLSAGVRPNWNWTTFGEWLEILDDLPLGGNVASHVGHGTLRLAVMGLEDRPAAPDELRRMEELLAASLRQGARGMTTGLIYPPGVFADDAELRALAVVLRDHGRLHETHMRNESDHVTACVRESIALAEATGVAVQIAHHKASGRRNFGASATTLAMVDDARARGLDVVINQHPYAIGSTTLRAILPGWAQEGAFGDLVARLREPATRRRILDEVAAETGEWDNYYRNSGGAEGVIFLNMPATPEVEGRVLAEVAAERGQGPLELALDLIVANGGADAAAFDNMGQEDIERIMRHPATVLISDAIPGPPGAKTHPRICGAFVRVLDEFVLRRGVLSLEEAIRKMTSTPARRLGFMDRGLLVPGAAADLLIMDLHRLRDTTTFANPTATPTGIDLVMINGVVTLEEGRLSGQRGGKVLR